MITALLQEIVRQFSLKALYLGLCWFAAFGYFMHMFVVMALTRLPFAALPASIARLHLATMAVSYVIAPVLAGVSTLLSHFYAGMTVSWFIGQQVYVWYTVCMMLFSSYLLCGFFVTVACTRFRLWLFVANAVVGILGLFVFKAMNLLVMV